MARNSIKGLKTIRFTEAQLSALKAMAEKDVALKAILPQHNARSGNGLEVRFATAVMRGATLAELQAQFPTLKAPRVKFLKRQADNAVLAVKASGHWVDAPTGVLAIKGPDPKVNKKAA